MVAVPADIPVTMPVAMPAAATDTLLLLHAPPEVALVKMVVEPVHTVSIPAIAAGSGLTVISRILKQPVGIL
jgi:hypothetical protein